MEVFAWIATVEAGEKDKMKVSDELGPTEAMIIERWLGDWIVKEEGLTGMLHSFVGSGDGGQVNNEDSDGGDGESEEQTPKKADCLSACQWRSSSFFT